MNLIKFLILQAMLALSVPAYAQVAALYIGGDTTSGNTIKTAGSLAVAYTVTSGNYTLGPANCHLSWNGSSNGTVNLPAALGAGSGNFKGRLYLIKNISLMYALTIRAASPELIDNQSGTNTDSIVLQPGYYCILISKGTTSGATWEAALTGRSNYIRPYFSATRSAFTPGSGGVNVSGYAELADDRNNFDPASGIFTAPEDGYYLFEYATTVQPAAAGVLAQRLSTGASSAQRLTIRATSSYSQSIANSYFVKMQKGNTINFFVAFANSAGSGSVTSIFTGLRLK